MRSLALVALAACASNAMPAPSREHRTAPRVDPYPLEAATAGERQVFALINTERAKAGLAELAWNGRLALVARRRSQAVRDGGPHDGAGADEHGNVATPIVVGNFARADTIEAAHAALMENATQRSNILSTDANQVGVGVVPEVSGDGVFVSEIFVSATPVVDTTALARTLRGELSSHDLRGDRDLDEAAQLFANGLARGDAPKHVWASVRSRLGEVDRRYARFRYSISAVADPDLITLAKLLGAQRPDAQIGIGVAQGTDPVLGDGAISIAIVIGEPR